MAATCAIEIRHEGGTTTTITEDVARHGVFVRTETPLPLNEIVSLTIALPERPPVVMMARVAHVLEPPAARALSRSPGVGLHVQGEPPAEWIAWIEGLESSVQRVERPLSIVVLDKSAPLRERLVTNLVAGGFEAHAAGDVATAIEACRDLRPDILLADAKTQGSNPLLVLRSIATDPQTADVAVVIMSEEGTDLVRLQAFRRGVRDFIPKPFTDEELMIRLRRVGPRAGRRARHVSLRGVIEDVGVPTVLALLEYEKRPGTLVLAREQHVGRIHVSEGRVRKVELTDVASSEEALDALLGWKNGSFAFLPGSLPGNEDMDQPISALLLEHARVEDEGAE